MIDSSGNGRNGTYTSVTLAQSPINGTGKVNGTASASATAGKGTVTYGSWMNSPSFTYEVLCYPVSFAAFPGVMGRATGGGNCFYWVWGTTGVNSYVYTTGASITAAAGTLNLSANTPYLLAIRFDGGSSLSYWANGVKRSETSTATSASQPGAGDITVLDGGGYSFQGRQSHAAMYTTALSDARLLAHAQAAGLA